MNNPKVWYFPYSFRKPEEVELLHDLHEFLNKIKLPDGTIIEANATDLYKFVPEFPELADEYRRTESKLWDLRNKLRDLCLSQLPP